MLGNLAEENVDEYRVFRQAGGHRHSAPLLAPTTEVVYICSSCWLLAHESRDLSQAEKKVTVVKPEEIHNIGSPQYDNYFH